MHHHLIDVAFTGGKLLPNAITFGTVEAPDFMSHVGKLLDIGLDPYLEAIIRPEGNRWLPTDPKLFFNMKDDFRLVPSMGSDIGCCPLVWS